HGYVLDNAISPDIAEHWRACPADAERLAAQWTAEFSNGKKKRLADHEADS
ncbi:hypothetical protein BVRB_039460, partial [Beta vulgaris subsp. vulgaris]